MFGVKYDKQIIVKEGSSEELREQGFQELFKTEGEARIKGFRLREQAVYQEFMNLSLEELDSKRAKELEQLIWKHDEAHAAGYHLERRKEYLAGCQKKRPS